MEACNIQIQSWKEVPLDQLAQFIYTIRQDQRQLEEGKTVDDYWQSLKRLATKAHYIPIIAYSKDQIIGWLLVVTEFPEIVFIGSWHPIVQSGSSENLVATQLIKRSITLAQAQKRKRLEVEFAGINAHTDALFEKYKNWYEAQGFYLATEEALLERNLKDAPIPEHPIPTKFNVKSIQEVTNEELRAPFFEMFNNSQDRLWLDLSAEQKVPTFEYWFDRKRPFIFEATFVLMKEDKIVGLTVVRPEKGIAKLGPIGVLPDYRQQGLGRALMALSMIGTLQSGVEKLQLEFDISNTAADRLYSSLGFQQIRRQLFFALNLD